MDRVRAIIIKEGKILLIKRAGARGENIYWVTPGGGVDEGENHERALKRECFEECGIEVQVGKLLYQDTSDHPATLGQILFFYFCEIIGGTVGAGQGPEFQNNDLYKGTYEPEWVDLENLSGIDLRPPKFKKFMLSQTTFRPPA